MSLIPFVRSRLADEAHAEAAAQMQAYLKTQMPFFGVKKPVRKLLFREAKIRFKPRNEGEWAAQVHALWSEPEREFKYLALSWARQSKAYLTPTHLDVFEGMIREAAWWDLVDELAIHLVGGVFRQHRAALTPVMRQWVTDPDVWIRRAATISQIAHKQDTDPHLLFDTCRRLASERSFWIRKAIGWSLREYGKTDPHAVIAFVEAHADHLSPLSKREALKRLG